MSRGIYVFHRVDLLGIRPPIASIVAHGTRSDPIFSVIDSDNEGRLGRSPVSADHNEDKRYRDTCANKVKNCHALGIHEFRQRRDSCLIQTKTLPVF